MNLWNRKLRVLIRIFCILLILIEKSNSFRQKNGQCVWYGVCNKDVLGLNQNCATNSAPKALDAEGEKLLSVWCGHLRGSDTCCDNEQLTVLNENVVLAENFLKNCPACLNNLVRHICDFTCQPQQSQFLEVLKTEKGPNGDYITEMNIHVAEEYMNNTYASCAGVQYRTSVGINMHVFDLMCGQYGQVKCSPQRWFNTMGDKATPFVPFQINYIAQPSSSALARGFKPLNPKTTACNEALDGKSSSCSCSDCPASC